VGVFDRSCNCDTAGAGWHCRAGGLLLGDAMTKDDIIRMADYEFDQGVAWAQARLKERNHG